MDIIANILTLLLFLPISIWSQMLIDSSQELDIKYSYEQIYTEGDFESLRNNLLSISSDIQDSLNVEKQITNLKDIQQERLKNDTLQICQILYSGDPLDFMFEIDGKELEFSKLNFTKNKIPDDYPHFENRCKIVTFRRSNKIVAARFESENVSYDCKLNLSYSTILIENKINISLSSNISTKPNTSGALPIPTEEIVIVKGAIEIKHTWSN